MGTHKKLNEFYNNVMAQAISTSGKYLFAGNCFGDIFVQDLSELEKTDEPHSKMKMFSQGKRVEINSLAFYGGCLIVGSIGNIYGLEWDEEKGTLSNKRKWQVLIPIDADALEVPDVNYLWMRPGTNKLYAGCGDNIIYQISLEDGRIVRSYKGHSEYIHAVTGNGDNGLFSTSEDGTVRFWCDNEKEALNTITPYKMEHLVRPELGKWIGAVAVNDNWLLCGGGPKLSIWHLKTLEMTNMFEFPGKVHVCDFIDDIIFVGGEYDTVQCYTLNGDLMSDIPVENTSSYSLVWQMEPYKFISVAGYSNKLHILNDFRFLDCKLDMYGNTES